MASSRDKEQKKPQSHRGGITCKEMAVTWRSSELESSIDSSELLLKNCLEVKRVTKACKGGERELREARSKEPEPELEPRARATSQSHELEPEPEPEPKARARARARKLESFRAMDKMEF